MKKRPVIGDIVVFKFYDHAENSKDALRFEAIGRVFKITNKAYLIKSWGYVNEVDKAADDNDANEVWFAIVKSAIDDIRILK